MQVGLDRPAITLVVESLDFSCGGVPAQAAAIGEAGRLEERVESRRERGIDRPLQCPVRGRRHGQAPRRLARRFEQDQLRHGRRVLRQAHGPRRLDHLRRLGAALLGGHVQGRAAHGQFDQAGGPRTRERVGTEFRDPVAAVVEVGRFAHLRVLSPHEPLARVARRQVHDDRADGAAQPHAAPPRLAVVHVQPDQPVRDEPGLVELEFRRCRHIEADLLEPARQPLQKFLHQEQLAVHVLPVIALERPRPQPAQRRDEPQCHSRQLLNSPRLAGHDLRVQRLWRVARRERPAREQVFDRRHAKVSRPGCRDEACDAGRPAPDPATPTQSSRARRSPNRQTDWIRRHTGRPVRDAPAVAPVQWAPIPRAAPTACPSPPRTPPPTARTPAARVPGEAAARRR